jgi:protein arginine N-methyltransferase 5
MARHPIALSLPYPLPPLPTVPVTSGPSPLQNLITHTLTSTDYDAVVIPLTNEKWQERWDRLCIREAEEDNVNEPVQREVFEAREREKAEIDREADIWRKEGGLKRDEVNVSRLGRCLLARVQLHLMRNRGDSAYDRTCVGMARARLARRGYPLRL